MRIRAVGSSALLLEFDDEHAGEHDAGRDDEHAGAHNGRRNDVWIRGHDAERTGGHGAGRIGGRDTGHDGGREPEPDSGHDDARAAEHAVEAWRRELLRRGVEAREIVPGARTLLIDGVADVARLRAELAGWSVDPTPPAGEERTTTIPMAYDGPDLALVAGHWDVPIAEVVRRHAATDFRVAFCGFAPGFAYLAGLPFAVPRLATPRTRVPAGSVALADRWCGVYPGESPGGWLIIGRTTVTLFDVNSDPPALLRPGGRVRFEAR